MKPEPSPGLLRLAQHRHLAALGVLVLSGALAAWAIIQTLPMPLAIIAWLLAPLLLAALVYQMLNSVHQCSLQANALAEMERQLVTLEESNTALKTARQKVAQQKMLAENLLAVARATTQQPILETMLQNVLDITAALTDTTHGSLFLLDPQGRIAQHLFTRQDAPAKPNETTIGMILKDGLAGWAIHNQQLASCHDAQDDPRWVERPDQPHPVRSAVVVPFTIRGSVTGVLTLTHPSPRHFTETHEKLLSSAADQIAVALDNAKMFRTMMRMADRMGLLYALSNIATELDINGVLNQSLDAIQRATQWPALAILLPSEKRNVVTSRAMVGHNMPDELSLDDTLIKDAWYTCSPVEVNSTTWGSILTVPICANEYVLGVLLVRSEPESAFNAEDIELVSAAAGTLAAALVNAELRRKVEELSKNSPCSLAPLVL